ncbi:MAG: DUF86 domain-containing protein [Thermoanaerobaculales bacterium]|nr:DUF86 domain-containing protein [Thermoanaerobaculales bacterium]MCU0305790.1 DUF86 domain-containing protein [Thermoanaerobaculales bacterium]
MATLAKEHGLIEDADLADRFLAMAGYRNRLTHHYEKVTESELFGIVSTHLGDIEAIAESLRAAAADLAELQRQEDPSRQSVGGSADL